MQEENITQKTEQQRRLCSDRWTKNLIKLVAAITFTVVGAVITFIIAITIIAAIYEM